MIFNYGCIISFNTFSDIDKYDTVGWATGRASGV